MKRLLPFVLIAIVGCTESYNPKARPPSPEEAEKAAKNVPVAQGSVGKFSPENSKFSLKCGAVEGQFTDFEGNIRLTQSFPGMKTTDGMTRFAGAQFTLKVASFTHAAKGPDGLDAEKYPEIKFRSTKVEGTPNDEVHFVLEGDLTIRETTKKVRLHATLDADRGFVYGKGQFSVPRADFGLSEKQFPEAQLQFTWEVGQPVK